MNIVNIEIDIDNSTHRMLGIGNVCVKKTNARMGVGSILMACVNAFLKKEKTPGILLCKKELVSFYQTSHWKIISPDEITVGGRAYTNTVMVFADDGIRESNDVGILRINRNF